jgi:uncharacterized protein YwqG
MVKRATLYFRPSATDIREPVTKFGGQPVWIDGPQWPLSKSEGTPMRFIGQVALDETLFPGKGGKLAYLFINDDSGDAWDAHAGENAVVIQPGGRLGTDVAPLAHGPTLQDQSTRDETLPTDVVLKVTSTLSEDPAYTDDDREINSWRTANGMGYLEALSGDKVGGTPGFENGERFPDRQQPWTLLLQLDWLLDRYFGYSAIGYAFINEDASVGKFLMQFD